MKAVRTYTLAAIVVFAFAITATQAQSTPRFINLDPWSWIQSRRTKSTSIMDYFFPPSRTPKASDFPPKIPESMTTHSDPSTATLSPTTQEYKITKLANSTKINMTTNVGPSTKMTTPLASGTTRREISPTTLVDVSRTTVPDYTETKKYTVITTYAEPKTETENYSNTVSDFTKTETYSSSEMTTMQSTSSMETRSSEEVSTETRTSVGSSRATPEEDRGSSTPALTPVTTMTPPEDPDSREGYYQLRDKTPVKITTETKKETVPLPAGSTAVLAKPTKYHYYPHNQHIYLLPECAIQQVCNAVYVRLNYTQPLCACPSRYRDPCSASLNADDLHTTRLTTDSKKKYASKAVTLVKTCEAVSEMRECRAPRDWSLLALQNIRTGKSHYLVICRCPENHVLEGPMSHDQPTYASVPGIRVYGMMCVRPTQYSVTGYNTNKYPSVTIQSTTSSYKVDYSQPHNYNSQETRPSYNRFQTQPFPNTFYNRMTRSIHLRSSEKPKSNEQNPPFPWQKAYELAKSLEWI